MECSLAADRGKTGRPKSLVSSFQREKAYNERTGSGPPQSVSREEQAT